MYHVHEQRLWKCIKKGYVEGIIVQKVTKQSYYKGFMARRLYRKPFPSREIRSTRRLQLVHSDFSGSLHTESSFGGVCIKALRYIY